VTVAGPAAAISATTERVTVAGDGTQANNYNSGSAISADGRYVTFWSWASDLVPGDTNNRSDIFVRDRRTGRTTRISVASDGTQGNGDSAVPAISVDGRYVAFDSNASNLVSGDTNGTADIFVRDRWANTTTRVSVAGDGGQANRESFSPAISASGRYVVFWSYASNLVPGDTNGLPDIFVRDRLTGATTRVNVATDGAQANGFSFSPAISADGRYVTYDSGASSLVPGDTNNVDDVFVRDRQTGTTTRVSVGGDGAQGNGPSRGAAISADGRYVTFGSEASNLVSGDTNDVGDVFVRDQRAGTISRVSVAGDGTQANSFSGQPSISADGRYVAFWSFASSLVPGDTNNEVDVFRRDRWAGATTRVSVGDDGAQGDRGSYYPAISADGRDISFTSDATNLVPGDTNNDGDVFVRG